jgi:hypothetical protein
VRIWKVLAVIGLVAASVSAREVITFEDFETGDARFFFWSVPALPSTVCDPPAGIVIPVAPVVLGDGTPGSATRAQIQAALDAGGHIVFDLGPDPQTIVLDQELVVTREVLLDGGDLVTLSGGHSVRVIRVVPPWDPADRFTLTLQRLRIINGRTPPEAASLPDNSGAGVLVANGGAWQEVSLVVVGCTFADNTAVVMHQDGGGGAIYAVGADRVVVVDSVFERNAGSNGGAVYSLGSDEVLISGSVFRDNTATGTGANPGNGGNAGALGVDGAERLVRVCGTVFADNACNAHGCGFFSVMYDQLSLTEFISCTFDGNANPTSEAHTGALYLQGGPVLLDGCLFRGNEAEGVGAVFVGPGAGGSLVNCTFTENVARGSLGGAMSISTTQPVSLSHCTVVANHAPDTDSFAGGIHISGGADVTLSNSVIADNTGGNPWVSWNIDATVNDGGGNFQWPPARPNGGAEVPATAGVTWADPLLGVLTDNGGPAATMAPEDPSPLIGAAGASPVAFDARGRARTAPADVGAFETP